VTSLGLEQHLKNASGHGCPAKYVSLAEREFLPKRSEPRWGEQAVL